MRKIIFKIENISFLIKNRILKILLKKISSLAEMHCISHNLTKSKQIDVKLKNYDQFKLF